VILHGTDTMSYTASALSFMLENLNKTVILTGSMIPLSAPVSDAKRNLIISLMCSVNLDIPEVCIFFNNSLLRGNRSKKLDPVSVHAFDSPNFPPLAEMGVHISIRRDLILQAPRRRFIIHKELFVNIAVLCLVPGFDDTCINAFVATAQNNKPVAFILQLYGAGNAPSNKKEFIGALENATARGCVVVATSQCLRGSVDFTQYATGSALMRLGVIDARDMTVEACVTKLSYLMGRGLRGMALKQAMESNLRGEMTVKHMQEYSTNEHLGNDHTALVEALISEDSTRIQTRLTSSANSSSSGSQGRIVSKI
jgi:L-asparaginase